MYIVHQVMKIDTNQTLAKIEIAYIVISMPMTNCKCNKIHINIEWSGTGLLRTFSATAIALCVPA